MIGVPGIVATLVVCAGDEIILDRLCEHLTADHFEVLPARSAADALRFCRYKHPDLMVVGPLPDASALDMVREIRDADGIEARFNPHLPIIVLVEPGGAERARCLDAGADDYLRQPFAYEELRLRIGAVLRRSHSRHDEPVRVGELVVDPARRRVTVGGRDVKIAKKEFVLLLALATDPTRVFSKDELLHDIWGLRAPAGRTRTLDSHASRLRRKLDPDGLRYVVNCWGIGYSLLSPDSEARGR
jgi:DNA-binding response OmpR family regulator